MGFEGSVYIKQCVKKVWVSMEHVFNCGYYLLLITWRGVALMGFKLVRFSLAWIRFGQAQHV